MMLFDSRRSRASYDAKNPGFKESVGQSKARIRNERMSEDGWTI